MDAVCCRLPGGVAIVLLYTPAPRLGREAGKDGPSETASGRRNQKKSTPVLNRNTHPSPGPNHKNCPLQNESQCRPCPGCVTDSSSRHSANHQQQVRKSSGSLVRCHDRTDHVSQNFSLSPLPTTRALSSVETQPTTQRSQQPQRSCSMKLH